MDTNGLVEHNGSGLGKLNVTLQDALKLDASDPLSHFRSEFIIPSKEDLKRDTLPKPTAISTSSEPCTYLCGNSLGVQPRRVADYISSQLKTWATKGVYGHFKPHSDSPIPAWTKTDAAAAHAMSKIVGASASEVAVMQTLTMNLHILMANFYRPTASRHKIIIEAKAFPSDHYAVESQIRNRGLRVDESMVLIEAPSPDSVLLPTEHILSSIDQHAQSAALLLLPGIQYYSGQFLDIKAITAHAQEKGIIVGWDLAHAVGNVPLSLHEWNVDFAAWCTYKYLNCGPGAMGGLFVHSRHHESNDERSPSQNGGNGGAEKEDKRHRLTGWWGHDLTSRFQMNNVYESAAGALGFQLSNPSALEHAVVLASLSVFNETSMFALREKSMKLTRFLETLLDHELSETHGGNAWTLITPRDPEQRGAQLSLRLEGGLLDTVMHELEDAGVVVDERHPDVVRVAPAPLYNSFADVFGFVQLFTRAVTAARAEKSKSSAGEATAQQ